MKLTFIIAASVSMFLSGFTADNNPINNPVHEVPCLEGEDEDPQPVLSGDVRDNSILATPIYHACVELKTTGGVPITITGTNINGHYYFNSISSGSYNLVVSATGFTTQTIPITISGTPQTINVTM